MAAESKYQSDLKKKIKNMFPGCFIFKGCSQQIQGFPDLIVLYNDKWAALEVKKSADASHRPNQDLYVERIAQNSYAAFVYPENEAEVLYGLQRALGSGR